MSFIRLLVLELKKTLKDRDVIILLLGAPVFLTLLFAGVYSHRYVDDIPMVVVDDDNSSVSRMIIREFDNHERFYIKYYANSKEELKNIIDLRKAYMGLYIPPHFSKDLNALKPTGVLVVVDGTNLVIGNNSYAAAANIIQTVAAGTQMKILQVKGIIPQSAHKMARVFDFTDRILYDPQLTYMNYLILGFVAVFLQQVMFSGVGISIIKDGENLVNNNPLAGVLTKIIACSLFALTSIFASVGILSVFFNLPIRGNLMTALIISAVFVFAVSCPSIIAASVIKDRLKFVQFAFMLSMPTFISCGYFWPQEQMPKLLVVLLKVFWPLINFARPFDEIIIKGLSLKDVSHNIYQMLLYILFWMPVSIMVLKREFKGNKEDNQAHNAKVTSSHNN